MLVWCSPEVLTAASGGVSAHGEPGRPSDSSCCDSWRPQARAQLWPQELLGPQLQLTSAGLSAPPPPETVHRQRTCSTDARGLLLAHTRKAAIWRGSQSVIGTVAECRSCGTMHHVRLSPCHVYLVHDDMVTPSPVGMGLTRVSRLSHPRLAPWQQGSAPSRGFRSPGPLTRSTSGDLVTGTGWTMREGKAKADTQTGASASLLLPASRRTGDSLAPEAISWSCVQSDFRDVHLVVYREGIASLQPGGRFGCPMRRHPHGLGIRRSPVLPCPAQPKALPAAPSCSSDPPQRLLLSRPPDRPFRTISPHPLPVL